MEKTIDHSDLTSRPLPEVIRQVAIPASLGFCFQTVFNVTDTWWAGRIDTQAIAALSLSLPVFFIISALASGTATGAVALMGAALGRKDKGSASLIGVQALSLGVMLSLFLAWFGLTFAPSIFGWLGAEGEYLRTCLEYMNPIFACNVVVVFIFLFNAPLQASGNTRSLRNVLGLAALLNIGLDPWFIHGGFGLPAMGLSGVAWATILVQGIGVVYLAYKARTTGLLDTGSGRNLIPRLKVYGQIARQGFPAALNSMTVALGFFVILRFVSGYGPQASAAYGIATRIDQIALLPTLGLGVAALTITAQSFGACRFDRIEENLRKNLFYGAVLLLPLCVPVFLLAAPLMRIFTQDPAVVAIGADYLRIDALTLYGYVVIFVPTSILQGMQRPMFAIWMGLARQVVLPWLLFTLFTEVLHLPITALWLAILVIVWTSAGVAYWYARRTLNRVRSWRDFTENDRCDT